MIKRYVYGSVIETEAILNKPEACRESLPYFSVDEESMTLLYTMDKKERVYGLGENVRGINKRGWIYESKCADEPNHTEEKKSLYAAHNFIVLDGGKETFGIFIDYPGILTFDIGYSKINELLIRPSDWNMDIYVITGEDPRDIIRQFRKLIGRSYVAPLWGFGYGQSRWGYKNREDILEVIHRYEELDIPLDSVYMDIDYMDHYKDFTVHPDRFPDFADFNAELKKKHIHLVPIIDAGVKLEEGYDVYDEGVEKGYFCTKEDGSTFVTAVWPGLSVFPDMLNKEARDWFGDHYKRLLDQGVEGFWNDMNEPAIFYTEESIEEAFEQLEKYKGRRLNLEEYWAMLATVNRMAGNAEDYKRFYHNMNGEKIRHDRVHNLFGYNMTRAAGEAFERLVPDKRILIFSRSSYIGMHRYGGIWQGDNCSWWSHMLLNFKMMPSLNMCGFLYTGADIGGFGRDTTEDLLMRWTGLGVFTPLMRNHSMLDSREQEAYQFTDIDGFRHVIGMRYRLLPYIYSEYMKAVIRDDMMFSPLAFVYPEDERALSIEDQLMVGKEIMIAPVFEQNAVGRCVYLPEEMKLYRFCKDGHVDEEILGAGDHYIPAELSDIILFVRPGCALPIAKGGHNVAEVDFENVDYLSFVKDKPATYEYYRDDGYEKDYDDPKHITVVEIK